MKTKLSKKRAIAIVLTNVIIIVAAVILGAGVVIYGSSLFQENTLIEGFRVSEIKLWVHTTDDVGVSWGAVGIRNTGDTTIAINKIIVRGESVPVVQWYADTALTPTEFGKSLNHTGWANAVPGTDGPQMKKIGVCATGHPEYLCIDQDSGGSGTSIINATAADGSASLSTGDPVVIYFKVNNGTLTPFDSGRQFSVSISAGKAISTHAVVVEGIS